MNVTEPQLPTYRSVAGLLEKEKGSGLELAGWTVLRTLLIAPPMMVVGVPAKQAFWGAALASILISGFTLIRIYSSKQTMPLKGRKSFSSRRRVLLDRYS